MVTLNVRGIDAATAAALKRAAHARGLTIGAYLARLVEFHHEATSLAEGTQNGDAVIAVRALLKRLGLETVRT